MCSCRPPHVVDREVLDVSSARRLERDVEGVGADVLEPVLARSPRCERTSRRARKTYSSPNEKTLASISHAITGSDSGMRMGTSGSLCCPWRGSRHPSRDRMRPSAPTAALSLRTHKPSNSHTASSFLAPEVRCCLHGSGEQPQFFRGQPTVARGLIATSVPQVEVGRRSGSIQWLRTAIRNIRLI